MKKGVSYTKGGKKLAAGSLALLLAAAFLLVLNSTSCKYYNLQKKLSPEYSEFFQKVRYIITREEEKIFLDLPDSEKDAFIEEFWKRRDPTPDTEENEFKMEYFNRIERSDEMFVSEGKPGWMTDRGRIYILFGPPTDRMTYPMGGDPYSRCREVWYYGNFPVVFVDSSCTGSYKLITYDLTSLREFNLMYMHELSLAQQSAQQTLVGETKYFNFDWSIKDKQVSDDRVEAVVQMEIPYANIWFKDDGGWLATTLEIKLELMDADEVMVWEKTESFDLRIGEDELKENKKKKYAIEIPFAVIEGIERLRKGTNKMFITLKNLTGGEEQKKVLDFNL